MRKSGYQNGYDITGKVWFRESTQEWVLELNGCINDSCFTCRHTQPKDTKPEDVPALRDHYLDKKGNLKKTIGVKS